MKLKFLKYRALMMPTYLAGIFIYLGWLALITSGVFWGFQIVRIPFSNEFISPITLSAEDAGSVLFGSPTLDLGGIQLKGIIYTSKGSDNLGQGLALFEVQGRPIPAVSTGELIVQDFMLHKISPQGVVISRHGQLFDLNLIN